MENIFTEQQNPSNALRFAASTAATVQSEIDRMEVELKNLKNELHFILHKKLVDLMIESGVDEMSLSTGEKFKLSTYVSGSLPKDAGDRSIALDWLTAHGAGGIVKTVVKCDFSRGEREAAESLRSELSSRGVVASVEETIHPQTLHAWVREALENGENIPFDTLGVECGQHVKIKIGGG